MKTTHHAIAAKSFSATTLRALTKRGIVILRSTFVPGPGGDYTQGNTAYELSVGGTSCLRTYLEVIKLAA